MPNIIGVPKMPGAMGHAADAVARQVARDRQRHAGDAALAGSFLHIASAARRIMLKVATRIER
jgi:hypothetical protein